MPTCQWRGGAPFCDGKCHDGEVQVASDSSATGEECWTGHKVLCCTQTQSDAASGQCKWEGAAPFCGKNGKVGEHYGCDESDRYEETFDSLGSGGESYCFSGYKSFCCTKPAPFTGCGWTSKEHPWLHPFTCSTGCPTGKQIIATDPSKAGICDGDTSSYYCCDAPLEDVPDDQDNLNFCQSLDDMYVLSNEYDDDENPADLIELYWYENEIFTVPNNEDPSTWTNTKRSTGIMAELQQMRLARGWDGHYAADANTTLPQVCNAIDCFYVPASDVAEVEDLLAEIRGSWDLQTVRHNPYAGIEDQWHSIIEKRTRSSVVRLPKNRRVRFVAATYNTVAELSGMGRQFWAGAAANTINICLTNKAAFQGRQVGRKYVTEHVTELQTPAQFAQSMIDGKYPDLSPVSGISSGYDWTQVFDNGGYMTMLSTFTASHTATH